MVLLAVQLTTAGFRHSIIATNVVQSSSAVTSSTIGDHWLGSHSISTIFSSAAMVLSASGILSPFSTVVSPVTLFSQASLRKIPNSSTAHESDHSTVEYGTRPDMINANMICDAQDLHEKCSSPPYFTRCNLDCPHNALCHVMMAEPHEPCLALCSCVGSAIDGAEDEFEGLD